MNILKTIIALLILSVMGFGCKKNNESSGFVEAYIVGSFICDEASCGTQFQRGYCILLENNKNGLMDFYTFNLPEEILTFPHYILKHHDSNNCGPAFFPDSLITRYKIRFQYHKLSKTESLKPIYGCYAMDIPFPWEDYQEASLESVMKW